MSRLKIGARQKKQLKQLGNQSENMCKPGGTVKRAPSENFTFSGLDWKFDMTYERPLAFLKTTAVG